MILKVNVVRYIHILTMMALCFLGACTTAIKYSDEDPVLRIKAVLERDDAKAFAAMVNYPIRVIIQGQYYIVETPKQFTDHYNEIIFPEFKEKLIESIPGDTWAKSGDPIIGRGYLYLNGNNYKIWYINNSIDSSEYSGAFVKFLDHRGRIGIPSVDKKTYQKFMNRLVTELSTGFNQARDEFGWYDLYKADINNDKTIEFILTYTTGGSQLFTFPVGVWKESGGKLIRLPFEKVVAKSLDNDNPDFEWHHIGEDLADPFLVIKDGTVYFGFEGFEYYVWKGDKVYKEYP